LQQEVKTAADVLSAALAAEAMIRPHLRETLLEHSLALSQECGAEVFLKLENLQHTGSFKARGAMHKLLTLTPGEWERGVLTASTGNHGAAVAWGLRKLGRRGRVYVPATASSTKLAAIRRYGAEIEFCGTDGLEAELRARQAARESGAVYISPYNDPAIVAGQGTVGLEIERQMAALGAAPDAVFVTVGGGGLISGVAGCLKAVSPRTRVIGCLPENSAVMAAKLHPETFPSAEVKPTLSDGSAGGLEPGAMTIPLCRELVDEYALASEDEIAAEMRYFAETHHMIIEGAAGVAAACFRKMRQRFRGQCVVIVICGGNVSLETLKSVLASGPQEAGR
jgi:threonine dehydratase